MISRIAQQALKICLYLSNTYSATTVSIYRSLHKTATARTALWHAVTFSYVTWSKFWPPKAKKDLYWCMCILKKLFCISIGKSKEGPYTCPGFSVHILWALFMLGLTLCQDHISISNTYLLLLPNFLLPIRFAEFGLPINMTKVSNIFPKTMGPFLIEIQ